MRQCRLTHPQSQETTSRLAPPVGFLPNVVLQFHVKCALNMTPQHVRRFISLERGNGPLWQIQHDQAVDRPVRGGAAITLEGYPVRVTQLSGQVRNGIGEVVDIYSNSRVRGCRPYSGRREAQIDCLTALSYGRVRSSRKATDAPSNGRYCGVDANYINEWPRIDNRRQ
ncbi:hypothetical protein BIW11_03299 [Tropilaelaps mercedesae]|uniref:Uncharacterized protein n=1 Tax=Tropilaelaps mercedesae TaxID=418985 RepID=A0A1V9XNS9_9ACAR|nr:hypothetical protein BIW11_03299 [Tropilaelaps mercedesae]